MKRLTAVFSAPFLGGSEIFNLEFLRDARAAGTFVRAVAPGEGALADALRGVVDEVVVLPIPAALGNLSRFGRPSRLGQFRAVAALVGYAWRLRRLLAAEPGAICALGLRAQLGVWIAGRGLGKRTAWVVHELVPAGRFGRLWSRAARSAELVLGFSRAVAEQPLLAGAAVRQVDARLDLSGFLALPPAAGSPIAGTPIASQSPTASPSASASPAEPPTIGLVGDLFPLKNHLGLLTVLDQLRDGGRAVDGLLVGRDTSASNPTAEYTAEVTRAVQARPGVRLLAAAPDEIPALMTQVTILLHLSTVDESFGRVCVEAMAAGRPVIAFARGAIPELIEPGVDGLLVPPGDLAAVAREVRALLDDPGRYERIASAARATARRRWDRTQPGPTVGEALADFA